MPDLEATTQAGARLGTLLRRGDVVLLYGDLGMGKTSLCRGLINSLLHEQEHVVSPTFTLVQTYDSIKGLISHYDLYRLEPNDYGALIELGWEDAIQDSIVLVEWSERLAEINVPKDALRLTITACPNQGRELRYDVPQSWAKRWSQL